MYPVLNPYGDQAEKKGIQRTSNVLILGAFASFGMMIALAGPLHGTPAEDLLIGFPVLALVLWVVGCCYYAKSKGYSALVGLLGILSLLGLLVLLFLPDRWKAALKLQEQFASMPPQNPFGGVAYPR